MGLVPMELGQTPCLKGQARAFKTDDFKIAVKDINTAILDKYLRATAASVKKQCKAFLLADGSNFEHFLELVSIKLNE